MASFKCEHIVFVGFFFNNEARGVCGLTCVQDMWQDSNNAQLTVLTGLLQDIFTEDLRNEHI